MLVWLEEAGAQLHMGGRILEQVLVGMQIGPHAQLVLHCSTVGCTRLLRVNPGA